MFGAPVYLELRLVRLPADWYRQEIHTYLLCKFRIIDLPGKCLRQWPQYYQNHSAVVLSLCGVEVAIIVEVESSGLAVIHGAFKTCDTNVRPVMKCGILTVLL